MDPITVVRVGRGEVFNVSKLDHSERRFVIVGPSGSGKSQMAAELRARYPHALIEEVQLPA